MEGVEGLVTLNQLSRLSLGSEECGLTPNPETLWACIGLRGAHHSFASFNFTEGITFADAGLHSSLVSSCCRLFLKLSSGGSMIYGVLPNSEVFEALTYPSHEP